MIAMVKPYLYGALALLLLGAMAFSYSKGNTAGKAEVQAEFDKYRGVINVQVQKAIIEKAQLEAIQNAKYAQAKLDYVNTRNSLDFVLDWLRKPKDMQGGVTLPLANMHYSSLSSQATNPSGIVVGIKTFPGTCSFEFYAAAMRDNLQCKTLIDFVSVHK